MILNKMKYFYLLFTLSVVWLSSCSEKTDLSQFPITSGGGTVVTETTYVQQSPVWTQFNKPEDILLGREPLIYVCDTKNNRVVQMDLSGGEIGSIPVFNPRAIAQDYNFDLLVIADTTSLIFPDTLSILYRIKLVPVGGVISNATLQPLMRSDYATPLSSRRRKFTDVGVYSDNSYIITRRGPENTSSLDPDNALLKVSGINSVNSVTVLGGFQPTGNGIYSIDKMSAITTFNNGPTDFIITRNTTEFGFKVEWFVYDNLKGTYEPRFLPGDNVDLLNYQLGTPEGITLDPSNNIFVVDNTRDSLYKFTSLGVYKRESFGGTGDGVNQLRNPMGVSFFNKVLYIADTGNNRIVRYKLSTDLQ